MKKQIRIVLSVSEQAGFWDNRHMQGTLQDICEQTGLMREAEFWYYDTPQLDFLRRGRFCCREQTRGSKEFLIWRLKATPGILQEEKRDLVRLFGDPREPFVWEKGERHEKLVRVLVMKKKQRIYGMKAGSLLWCHTECFTGNHRQAYHELEILADPEDLGAAVGLARRLSQVLPLSIETKSLACRAVLKNACGGQDEKKKKRIRPGGKSAKAWMLACLEEGAMNLIQAEKHFHSEPQEADALHQMRVSLRILRSYLSFGKPLMKPSSYTKVSELLQDFAQRTAEARDVEVLLARIWNASDVRTRHLQQELRKQKRKAYEGILAYLRRGGLCELMLTFECSVYEANAWERDASSMRAKTYIERRKKRWYARIQKEAKTFSVCDMDQVHRLRILCKKLRYVLREACDLDEVDKKRIRLLTDLQGILGRIHDDACQRKVLDELSREDDSCVAFESGYYLGLVDGILKQELKQQEKRIEKLLKKIWKLA